MSNKSKVLIAVFIVAGIAGLIIFDLALSKSPAETVSAPPPAQSDIIEIADDANEMFNGWQEQIIGQTPTPPEQEEQSVEPRPQVTPQPDLNDSRGLVKGDQGTVEEVRTSPQVHTVKQGESWWIVARKIWGQGHLYKHLQKANPAIQGFLKPGTELMVPPAPGAAAKGQRSTPDARDGKIYTVKKGDTLGHISQREFGTVRYATIIFEANKELIRKPELLREGMQILIPARPAEAARTTTPNIIDGPSASSERLHVVKSGDSLWKIASQYSPGHTEEMIQKIVRANPGKLSQQSMVLRVGWKLVIPQ